MSVQLDLLAGLPVPPTEGTLKAAVARARGYVDERLSRRVCAYCCGDERLLFQHRWPMRLGIDEYVARLVQAGVSRGRLGDEIAKCRVLCRRCQLASVHPKMLRWSKFPSVGMVAKGSIARCWGRKTFHGGRAKARGIVEGKRSRRVA